MKRVDLTKEQLEDVVRHRQSGLSWLGIHNATGISRRVCQRSYEQWEKARSIRELENVRVKVGEIEFERHLNALDQWAGNLIDHLSLPVYPDFTTDAETYFERLMERERDTAEPSGEGMLPAREDRARDRNIRRNRLLFESLKEHTADRVRWDRLADWMAGWNTCSRIYPGVAAGVAEVVGTALDGIPGFDELFVTSRGQHKPSGILTEGIRDLLWKVIVAGDIGAANSLAQAEAVEVNNEEVLRITIGSRSLLQKENREMVPSLVDLCRGLVNELWNRDETKVIREAVDRMRGVVEELETELEPLVLRPHILTTRCRICPA